MIIFVGWFVRSLHEHVRARLQKCAQNAKKRTFNIKNSTASLSLSRLSSLHFLFCCPVAAVVVCSLLVCFVGFSAVDSYSSIFRKRAHSRCGNYMLQLQLSELPKSMTKCATSIFQSVPRSEPPEHTQ